MELIFDPDEILNLIADYGQQVTVCDRVESVAANVEFGLPSQHRLQCRDLRGYVTEDTPKAIAVNKGLDIVSAGYTAYIYGGDLNPSQIGQNTLIAFQGKTYHITLIRSHGDKRSGVLHEFRLLKGQDSSSVSQADEIIETNPIAPSPLVVNPHEVDPLFRP